jgi:xylulokinase
LTLRLAGSAVTDRGDASGTGYWSPAAGRYRTDLLERLVGPLDWERALPAVLGPTDAAGRLRPEAARALGLAPGSLVAAGTGDNMGAALGLALAPGDVALSLGTSGTVYTVAERPTADASGAVAGFADASGRFLPLVCTLNATRVTDTFARLLGLDREAFDAAALAAPAGAGGLVLVPYLDGERTPNRPDAAGTLHGLRAGTTREQLARAAVEGVACGLLEGLDHLGAALARAGAPLASNGRLLLVGGGARSPAYRRALADLAAREVVVPEGGEHVATGACVQAAAALLGRAPGDVARAWGLGGGAPVAPDPRVDARALRAAYAAARA